MGLLAGRPMTAAAAAAHDKRIFGITSPMDLIPIRSAPGPGRYVDNDRALRHSAVWSALRLRAGLISTFPLDLFRRVGGVQIECPKPPVLVNPSGAPLGRGNTGMPEWLYGTQMDLDRAGNTIGLITAVDGLGNAARIEMAPIGECAVLVRKGALWKYRICGTLYDPEVVWHEKAYTAAGCFVGLSPVAYAAYEISQYLTVQDFATNWFAGGAVPRARLKNTAKTINPKEAAIVKESWRASITVGEPFVHGSDWDYEMIMAQSASNDWIEAMKSSIPDIARFFDVPVDLIDGTPTGGTRTMTYANISQRNLQLLIMNLGPAIIRREAALSGITPSPRYVKFNTDALLRLDPMTRAAAIAQQIASRTLSPDEARELENRPPLTQAQIEQFLTLFPPVGTAVPLGAAADDTPAPPLALPPGDSNDPGDETPGDTVPPT